MNVVVRWALVAITVIGLAVDAYTHFHLASMYAFNKTSVVSEETLFRIEAVLAILAALAVLIRPNGLTATIALLVAAGGLALLLIYRYVDVGKIGPIPDMYDPGWFKEKVISALGEAVAMVGSLGLLVASMATRRRRAVRV
ncbi:MAG: hypothetical protein M3070_03870 [Actinomycetota bacterium]|nr:hypothetical protein [Actinomycetota bacterium]